MTASKEEYVIAYFHNEGGVRTMRMMATSYDEAKKRLHAMGILRYELSNIPGSATYTEQREKVKQWLRLS